MSARIAPRAETIGIGFSPHLPKFLRSRERQHEEAPTPGTEQNDADPLAPPAGFGASATGSLPSQIIFEAALLGLQQSIDPPTPQEVARRLRNEWSPPVAGFKLTDKTI